ncbi:ASCH domain-containing protein [Paenibacillus sp. MMS20-IR301]|uniref:ASCH domain-containing protein n=1 Tax=Paenibacillus sp. MMS20-IR301 TaxID=2895946 RepID=UPI0028E2C1EE|nr:ASCH domain-containing protein [Paenibacillus sp. MMS20-IR301]WNS40895.1 ASCH domain-containing protein [Paenibacillus sp. MMS20-IR301]
MTLTPAIARYWEGYLALHPEAADHFDSAWAFGDNPRLADELLDLVLQGIKTGTAQNYELSQARNIPLPFEGGLSILLDSTGEPRAIIETTKVEIVPFGEVTPEFAYSEGEDDRSLASWRYHHEVYFTRELQAEGKTFDPDMRVVCETFRLVDTSGNR